jgi:hypothetical protein
MTIEEARQVISGLASKDDPIIIQGTGKARFLDELDLMLGGDPWQEGANAMDIIRILTGNPEAAGR